MEIVTITPTSIEHLEVMIRQIIEKCNEHNVSGFNSYTSDFHYLYHLGEEIAGRSEHSCPVCRGFNDVGTFRGDQMEENFPASSKLDEDRVYPDVHVNHPDMEGKCGCELELTDLSEACAKVLADEIRMAVT